MDEQPAPARPRRGGPEHTRRCEVSVNLTDTSFQSVGAQTYYLAHAARYYLAAQTPRGPIYEGDRVKIPVRAIAVDGEQRVRVEFFSNTIAST